MGGVWLLSVAETAFVRDRGMNVAVPGSDQGFIKSVDVSLTVATPGTEEGMYGASPSTLPNFKHFSDLHFPRRAKKAESSSV